ncbi:YdhK family protein [Lederbergia sp. NSJ-179]|uniref:YdhK family protein n=1 Tax=Lederbergia sp. NSJ-179 TaxID=2931402 RepID=UPI001FCF870C|nr:YdhK family protein [Lederbergia sp. NSJ-179]MCJ7841407.1 YdhK family protein [Lederbergia sp. NSJ-179]
MSKHRYILTLNVAMLALGTCGQATNQNKEVKDEGQASQENVENNQESTDKGSNSSHDSMHHSSSGEVPEGLKEAKAPKYTVGSQAIIETDHMKGMDGAEATIVGAYDTIAYVVSYKPTNGGEPVKDYKWVIQEEIADDVQEPVSPGTEVTLEADHMEGMKGATAEIESSEHTNVYMIDCKPSTGGEEVKNHKWVTANELGPVQQGDM